MILFFTLYSAAAPETLGTKRSTFVHVEKHSATCSKNRWMYGRRMFILNLSRAGSYARLLTIMKKAQRTTQGDNKRPYFVRTLCAISTPITPAAKTTTRIRCTSFGWWYLPCTSAQELRAVTLSWCVRCTSTKAATSPASSPGPTWVCFWRLARACLHWYLFAFPRF